MNVLDHGDVTQIETWGSDERIVEAARMSTGKGHVGWGPKCRTCGDLMNAEQRDCPMPSGKNPSVDCGRGGHMFTEPGDEKLLGYLWSNRHATPFEMAGAIFEIQAPIFVFREWHRHRTQSYNELSARYTTLPDVNYIPSVERLMIGSDGKNRQAGTITEAGALDELGAKQFRAFLRAMYESAEEGYQEALKNGVPKELARIHLPVGRYSRMRASANLRNWLAFLTLRSTAKNIAAQWEIRQCADAVHAALRGEFPRTIAIFDGGA